MPHVIDLRSDTVTRPTAAMRQAIAAAEVGDDMSGEDPSVNRLEAHVAELLGMEAAVYNCSGTQSNQMAVRAHCQQGDELLIEELGHIANYEAGGAAALSGVTCRTIRGHRGRLDVPDLEGKIRADNQHFSPTRLVCLENSTNLGGGRTYSLARVERIGQWAHAHGLQVHVDGARLFNACIARGYQARDFVRHVDSVSICFSKGLGCPMGSILVGRADFILRARRARKLFGGALRQAGMMAAAATYALQHHVGRLVEDHAHARLLADEIAGLSGLQITPEEVETNLVFFEISPDLGTPALFAARLAAQGVRLNPAGPQRLRACTHLDVSREDILRAAAAIRRTATEGATAVASPAVPTGPYGQ